MRDPSEVRIGVIGLGYVGFPLAATFGAVYPTVGFDSDITRVEELRNGLDHTRQVRPEEFAAARQLRLTADPGDLQEANFYVVAVPTPLDSNKAPDLNALRRASETVGSLIGVNDVVVFESTVYPGATEEVCVPIIEQVSGLRYNRDFFVGYSPERINPGDHERRVTDIVKVTSGSTPEAAALVDAVYGRVIRAGTYRASSIRVAEAAKVIENTQRAVNIALINELAMIFGRLGLDTHEVLAAAGTKWNFMPFKPGLVGGHCIGIDPYYLAHKAIEVGVDPEIILAGCRTNGRIGAYVADRVKALLAVRGLSVDTSRVLVLGLTFKENCPDLRNTRVVDIVARLQSHGARVEVWDPWADAGQAQHEYGLELLNEPECGVYDAIVLAVAHREFAELGAKGLRAFGKSLCVVYDIKGMLPADACDARL